jgi:uncharacterized protein (TIGR02246 family)
VIIIGVLILFDKVKKMITEQDKAHIDEVLKKMAAAWAAGDGTAYGSLFLEDAHYVEAPGFRAVGAKMIGERHQQVFDTFFKYTRIGGDYQREIQALTPDVVVIHSEGNVYFLGEQDKKLAPNGIVSMCVVKRANDWKIASFQNTPTGKFRRPQFFFRFLRSRFYMMSAKWKKEKMLWPH